MTSPPSQRRRVVLLGATGSIGRQACDVIARFPDEFTLVGAVAGGDAPALASVIERFGLTHSALVAPADGASLPPGCGAGLDAACEVAALDADVVCVAITGGAALRPAMAAVEKGTDVALATKEVLVMAGELVQAAAARSGSQLLPVDSEHSAIWQCLRGEDLETVRRLILTASGGPFRTRRLDTFDSITVDEALAHPTWDMGPKVTIDSATMMNKGLEIIEAHFLFGIPYPSIEVVVHPSSRVHSMVDFVDGATMAQIGVPDMRIPIALALSGGRRLPNVCGPVGLTATAPLEFHAVDGERFPALALARHAGERGGGAPCVLNAANEAAVSAFLSGRCAFDDIPRLVEVALGAVDIPAVSTIDAVLELDRAAREAVDRSVVMVTS